VHYQAFKMRPKPLTLEEIAVMIKEVAIAKTFLSTTSETLKSLENKLDTKLSYLIACYNHVKDIETHVKDQIQASVNVLDLNFRGTSFFVDKNHLMINSSSTFHYFHPLIYSLPSATRGHYYIDRPYEGFDRILQAMRVNAHDINYNGCNEYEINCIEDNLLYFKLPFSRYKRHYTSSHTWVAHDEDVTALCVLHDDRLCSGSTYGSVKIWNITTYTCEAELNGHTDGVVSIVEIGYRRIFTASWDTTIRAWDSRTGECQATMRGHQGSVTSIFQRSPTLLCSASYDGEIRLWNISTFLCEKVIPFSNEQSKGVASLEQLPNGNVACLSYNWTIAIWDIDAGIGLLSIPIRKMKGHSFEVDDSDNVAEMVMLKNGNLCTSMDNELVVWDYKTGLRIRTIKFPFNVHADSLALLRDGRIWVRVRQPAEAVAIYEMDTEECEQQILVDIDEVPLPVTFVRGVQLSDRVLCYSSRTDIVMWR
jgi:WD40 repeat protein